MKMRINTASSAVWADARWHDHGQEGKELIHKLIAKPFFKLKSLQKSEVKLLQDLVLYSNAPIVGIRVGIPMQNDIERLGSYWDCLLSSPHPRLTCNFNSPAGRKK